MEKTEKTVRDPTVKMVRDPMEKAQMVRMVNLMEKDHQEKVKAEKSQERTPMVENSSTTPMMTTPPSAMPMVLAPPTDKSAVQSLSNSPPELVMTAPFLSRPSSPTDVSSLLLVELTSPTSMTEPKVSPATVNPRKETPPESSPPPLPPLLPLSS